MGMTEEGVAAPATEIDDQVGVIPRVAQDGLGGQAFGGVAVVLEGLLGGRRDVAEREKAGAGRIDDVGGFAECDGFGHGAAAGVADADEEDAEYFGVGHVGIVAWIFEVGLGSREEVEESKVESSDLLTWLVGILSAFCSKTVGCDHIMHLKLGARERRFCFVECITKGFEDTRQMGRTERG